MGWKSFIIQPYAKYVKSGVEAMADHAVSDQNKCLNYLLRRGASTLFGRDHDFDSIANYDMFKAMVPVRDYERLRPYIDKIIKGEQDVLWPGIPKYFAKTSGTTSGVKYIPITKESVPNHIFTAQKATLNYLATEPAARIFDGKVMFLGGSPVLEIKGSIPTGRLSGIVNHEVPAWIRSSQMPTYNTNCIEDWESKVDAVVRETSKMDMRLISGIPPWVQMYYERLLDYTGKSTIREIFPNFNLFIYGGVNYEPYRATIEQLIGAPIPSVELYPASEGFIAFQSDQNDDGLLLNTNSGIFFEFVPLDQAFDENPERLKLDQVELDKDYVLIINNNAGLWGYNIGDTVRFTSLDPYKVLVSGRVKHYISAFGEHVIGKEVEEALNTASKHLGISVVEFTVAPQVKPEQGLPYHEWFIEFNTVPDDLVSFTHLLENEMRRQNIYYDDLLNGNILKPLVIRTVKKDTFRDYMKERGKLGGQNKVPRLSNDRKIADNLQKYIIGRNSTDQ
jgi:hypothetical protein